MKPFKTIESQDFLIEEYNPKYLEDMFRYRSDKRVNEFYSIKPKNIEELGNYFKEYVDPFQDKNSYSVFVIKVDGVVVGDISVSSWNIDNKISAIGYCLSPDYWGKGIGTKALRIFVTELFNTYGRNRIQADVSIKNDRSIALVERVGFLKEGHFRQIEYANNQWVDNALYAMLVSDLTT